MSHRERQPTQPRRTRRRTPPRLPHGAAFDLMFHPDHQPDLASLDQREARACASVDDLKAWLLAQHLGMRPRRLPPARPARPLPRCGKPAARVERPDGPLFKRPLTTPAGEVSLKRAKFRCATCRVAFSPLDKKLRLGVEGYSGAVLCRAARQAQKAASFAEASSGLSELAGLSISPTHLRRLAGRIGKEWTALRDGQVGAFRQGGPPVSTPRRPRRRRSRSMAAASTPAPRTPARAPTTRAGARARWPAARP